MLFSSMIKSSIVYQDSSRHEPEPPLRKDNSNIAKSNHICITIRMNTNKQWIISQDNIHGILVDILTCVSYLRVMRWLFLSHTVILLLLLFSIGKRRLLTGDIHTWAQQRYGDFDSSILVNINFTLISESWE